MLPFIMLLFPLIWNTFSQSQWQEGSSETSQRRTPATQPPPDDDKDLYKLQKLYLTYIRNINILGYLSLIPVALAAVHLNTIIHPFTLADNRHYMFYAFRYTILRAGWVRYALAPAYVLCWAACWKVLGGWRPSGHEAQDGGCPAAHQDQDLHPGRRGVENRPHGTGGGKGWSARFPLAQDKIRRGLAGVGARKRDGDDNNNNRAGAAARADAPSRRPVHPGLDEDSNKSDSNDLGAVPAVSPPSLSTALLWLLATGLSLVTAPLVEPRYFILPWVIWRLLAPAWPAHSCRRPLAGGDRPRGRAGVLVGGLVRAGRRLDVRLVLETVWFVVVHLVTAYVFVARPFYWRAGDGALLDGGRVQRFMW